MNLKRFVVSGLVLAALGVIAVQMASAQEKMTKEEWQSQITQYTAQRDSLKNVLAQLTKDVDSLKSVLASLTDQVTKVKNETLALTGASADRHNAFDASLKHLEDWAQQLSLLSNADLYARRTEVDSLQAQLNSLKQSKLAALPDFYNRIQALQQKIDQLKATLARPDLLAGLEKTYTVGTWARDRDCLWNISKKKSIYDNPFMWPKIWQGNRDQIKDPDIIHPGQKLKIPVAGPLTDSEKKAERRYWRNKHAAH
jgi:nucleoid-associated protein YgaU